MMYKNGAGWYAVFVATGEEDKVKARINFRMQDRLRAIVPKRRLKERREGRWEDKIRTLFPGYILLNGMISNETYGLVRDIPGVIRFLRDKDGPLQIHKSEIEVIGKLTADCEIIGYSRVYVTGEKVTVIDGPLYGMEGCIKSIDKRKGRAKVLLNIMNEPRLVELSVALVQPA
jgi:transcriptional antiterminator NusG